MTAITFLIFAIVTLTHLPRLVFSMQTENGYLCNLCHSLQNEFPYPPPVAEGRVVRFTQSENEQFGTPFERGSTCLEIWDTVLDFANDKVYDLASCRAMARAYAWQCCNTDPRSPDDQEPATNATPTVQSSVEGLTMPQAQNTAILSRVSIIEEKPRLNRSNDERISATSMGMGRDSVVAETVVNSEVQSRGEPPQQQHRPLSDRISTSNMGNGREDAGSTTNDNNVRRTSTTSYLRGK